ncbi:MAG: hypothetical protein AB1Z65_02965 [Candidatus Sulfomarinibacteraceae bacterium]
MERYDAILEQLKHAQRRGMETISNRLDFVVQSLEELIQEAKNSVQEALPESADECLPIAEVEEALRAFHDEAQAERRRAADLEDQLAQRDASAETSQPAATVELLRTLDAATSQSELLKELLPAMSSHSARAVVLVLREGRVSAWSGIGFTDGERLRAWQGDAVESPALTMLLEHSRPVRFAPADDEFFARWLDEEEQPTDILLIPVVLRGKLMGAVYVDRLDGHPWSPNTAQTLVAQVCWLIDTLQFRPTAAPSLAEPLEVGAADQSVDAEATATEERVSDPYAVTAAITPDTVPEEGDEDVEEPAETEPETIDAAPATEVESAEEAAEEEPVAAEIDPSATMKIDLSEMPVSAEHPEEDAVTESVSEPEVEGETFEPDEPTEPEVGPVTETESFSPDEPTEPEFEPPVEDFTGKPEETAEETTLDDVAEVGTESIPSEVQMPVAPPVGVVVEEPEPETETEDAPQTSQFLDEPPPVQPVQPPPDEPEEEMTEDEAQQEEARRFARLLVSEIKLYNEEQVERGREAKDLYDRLKEDIDRSREMFDKRISEEIRRKQDFFQDELVRILADGDPDVLGT